MWLKWKDVRGSATVFSVVAGFIIISVGFILIAVLQAAIMRAQLGSYADLAALAASQSGGNACAAASVLAQRNGVSLVNCELGVAEVAVTVRVSTANRGLLSLVTENVQVSARASRFTPITE
jgi:secretion/DNA translocation related TadE-like protein